MSTTSERQRDHYERLHDAYEAHYYDAGSLAYRERFILDPLLDGLDLRGARLADLASGSGHNTALVRGRFPSLTATGFDISAEACRDYAARTGFEAHRLDLSVPGATEPFAERFDAAVVIGGLHHCVADLPSTIDNVHRLLRPGGALLMFEPNAAYVLEAARALWYRGDALFDAESERALRHEELLALAGGRFEVERLAHLGGPAYFVVLNSMVLRVPRWLKDRIAAPSMALERAYNRVTRPRTSAYFVARWRRRA